MGHGHHHEHDHGHVPSGDGVLPPALDASIPDGELSPGQLSRRSWFRGAGLLGAGIAAGSVLNAGPAAAEVPTGASPRDRAANGYLWLKGDHHIHTQYSDDGKYRVIDQARQGNAHGLDWMVITDHGGDQHAKIGVRKVNPDIVAARQTIDNTLIFQGLEWNIPGAEHGTVFVHPGRNEVAVLQRFEQGYDAEVQDADSSTAANEALAVAGLRFLASAVSSGQIRDAVMLANHPSRKGIDSPHEMRNWRDNGGGIAIGMEGAPGHQANGIPDPAGPGGARGEYDHSPSADSFPGYPLESYRTFGGFDWMTATVGGLWDSMLAEGKPWWITLNSDSHLAWADTSVNGPNSDFDKNGFMNDPVHGGSPSLGDDDFWPGQYAGTHVGSVDFSYRGVMDAMRAGRIWVTHGGLISGLDMRVTAANGQWQTLGGVLHVRRGDRVRLQLDIDLANTPNWAQVLPVLSRVDVIQGGVTGSVRDRDTFAAPTARVVKSFEVGRSTGSVRLTYNLGSVDGPLYLRVRGTDGNRGAVGLRGAAVDPHGPAMDVAGDADPWKDLWFYTNPIWVLPA